MNTELGAVAVSMIALATALIACGGDGSSTGPGSGGIRFDLPAEKKLSQLSPSEALAACKTAADGAARAASDPDVVRFECTLLAVLASGAIVDGMEKIDLAACKQQLATCVASPKHEGTATSTQTITCDPANVAMQFAGCEATVGEVQACFNASLSTIEGLVGSITCESASSTPMPLKRYISLPTITGSPSNGLTVPECKPILTKCPSFDLGASGTTKADP